MSLICLVLSVITLILCSNRNVWIGIPAYEEHATNDQHCSDDVSFSLTEDTILLIGVSIVKFVSKNEEYFTVRKRYKEHRNNLLNQSTYTKHNLQCSRTYGWIKAALTTIDFEHEEKPQRVGDTDDPSNTH